MFTLRIVFVGLIALGSANSEQGVMLLSNEARHRPLILLRQDGECASGACRVGSLCEDQSETGLCWDLDGSEEIFELSLAGEKEGPLVLSSGRTRVDGERSAYPRFSDEARDLSWVPSVGQVVPGPGPLRRGCRRRDGDCPAWARFWLDNGRLSACHFLHVPEEAKDGDCKDVGKLLLFDVGGDPQAVANAVVLEVEVSGDSVWLQLDQEGSEPTSVALKPRTSGTSDQPATVTLVIANEPLANKSAMECELAAMTHFPAFYRFLDPVLGVLGRMSRSRPEKSKDGATAAGVAGSCEEDVRWLASQSFTVSDEDAERYSLPSVKVQMFPEGASECDLAAFP